MAEAYNKGGTVEWEGIKATLTDANHSSSGFADGVFLYLGESCGIVFELEDGTRSTSRATRTSSATWS